MKKFKIAVVGAGNMASEHVKAFTDIADVELIAIASRGIESAKALAQKNNITYAYTSLSEMYQKHQPDGLVIAVPELQTYDVLIEASRFPWSILAEKPVGCNYFEARRIFEELKHRQNSIFVAFNRRHYSSTKAVLGQIQSEAGHRIVVVNDQEDPESALADNRPKLVVENWMYANSIHLIDYFTFFCRGELLSVNNVIPWRGMGTEFTLSELEFSSGDKGIYMSYWNRPHPWVVSVSTKEKWWEIRPIETASSISKRSRVPVVIEKNKWDLLFKPGIRQQAEEFIHHLRQEKHNLPNLSGSLQTMELVKKLYE
jgi:predicted dehydrogenase